MGPKVNVPKSHGKTPIGGYYSPGYFNDGGGFVIYLGHDGKLHIKYIPPREPVLSQLNQAASLMAHAEGIGDTDIANQMRDLAQAVLDTHAEQIIGALNRIEG